MFYNILYGFVDIDASSLFDTSDSDVIRSRDHSLRIFYCSVNCRSSSFVCRNVNIWNTVYRRTL